MGSTGWSSVLAWRLGEWAGEGAGRKAGVWELELGVVGVVGLRGLRRVWGEGVGSGGCSCLPR